MSNSFIVFPHFAHMFNRYTTEDKEIINKVGQKIKQLRNKHAISQNELALRAEIPKNQVGRIERGQINTSLVTLNRIAKALEEELWVLFSAK